MSEALQERIDKAVAALKAAGAREVYLFGSRVGGTAREDSDVDMAVAGLPPEMFIEAMGQVGDILQFPFDLVDLDEENPFTRYLRSKEQLRRVG